MKNYSFFLIACFFSFIFPINANPPVRSEFTFMFITDVHLQPEQKASEAFKKVMGAANRLAPAFIINGGDIVFDAMDVPTERATSLFDLYNKETGFLKSPIYNTIGNHDVFGIKKTSGVDPSHEFYGKKMYIEKVSRRYYSFEYGGWHFFVLDAIALNNNSYYGSIDEEQLNWIKGELKTMLPAKPIAIVSHLPFRTLYKQEYKTNMQGNDSTLMVVNANEVLNIFKNNNLKLVLQGHLHYYEDLYVSGIRYITGGAVSGNWWNGPINNIKEGYTVIQIKDEEITAKYVEYGWTAIKK